MQHTNMQDKKKKKKKDEKNKNHYRFLLCCLPVAMDRSVVLGSKRSGSGNRVFDYIKMENTDGDVFPRIVLALPSSNNDKAFTHQKQKGVKNYWCVFKGVFFRTSSAKKIKKRQVQEKLNHSNYNPSAEIEKGCSEQIEENSIHEELVNRVDGRNNIVRSTCMNSRPLLERKQSFRLNTIESKQKPGNMKDNRKGYYSSDTGLYLLLLSLLFLVCWGKICAILCVSTWLFFLPRCNANHQLQNKIGIGEGDSKECKKKIIMEGLLERNHKRGL